MDIYWIALGLIAFFLYYRIRKSPGLFASLKNFHRRLMTFICKCRYRVGRYKDVVEKFEVEFLDLENDKVGKKMKVMKNGMILHYTENLWSGESVPVNQEQFGLERTKLIMENDDERIILRTFDDSRVFCIEAAEVALKVYAIMYPNGHLLSQQFTREIAGWLWSSSSTNLKTMKIYKLTELFNRFGFDKQFVTLIPDPVNAYHDQKRLEDPMGLICHKMPGPYCHPVYPFSGVMSLIYRDIVSHVDWSSRPEELKDLRNEVVKTINNLGIMAIQEQPDTYISGVVAESAVRQLADHPSFLARKGKDKETEMRRIWKYQSDEKVYLENVKDAVDVTDAFTCLAEEFRRDVLLSTEGPRSIHIKELMDLRKAAKSQKQPLGKKSAKTFPVQEPKPVEHKEKNGESVENEWKKRFEVMEKNWKDKMQEMVKQNKLMKETIREIKKEKEQLKMEQLKPCAKCYRTHMKCEEAKTNLKTLENKLKKLEGKLDTAEKVVKEYKEKEASIRADVENEWKENFEAMEKKLKNEKEMKSKMTTITKENKAIKDSNEELKREKEQLKQSKDQLQEILKQKDLEIVKLREQRQLATSEARLKDQRIEDLTKTYSRLIEENEKLKKKSPTTSSSNSEDPSSSPSSSSLSESSPDTSTDHLKKLFMELVDTKNRHLQEQRGIQATEKVQKLKTLSNDAGVRSNADLELKRYNLEYQKFMDSLTKNISNLQEFLMEFVELPDAPELSNEFMTAYDEAIARELLRNLGPDEISDPECVICHDNMMELEGTLKCSKCRRRYHVPCVGKWLTENTGCPVCKTNLRDLEKYPELAPYRS